MEPDQARHRKARTGIKRRSIRGSGIDQNPRPEWTENCMGWRRCYGRTMPADDMRKRDPLSVWAVVVIFVITIAVPLLLGVLYLGTLSTGP